MKTETNLPEVQVIHRLKERGLTLAAAESCTGGLIAKRLTDVPGASSVFLGGVVSYTNGVKERVLGVPADRLEAFGAVSRETAEAMAEGVRSLCGADLAVSITGSAGPDPDERGTPVGTGWLGFSCEAGTDARLLDMGRSRAECRAAAADAALQRILEYLDAIE